MTQFCVQKTKCSRTAQSCKLDKNDNGYLFFLCNFNCCSTEIPRECHWRMLSMSGNEIENNSCRTSHHKVCIMGINEHWIHQQNEANSPTTKDASLYPHFASSSFHSSLNVNASSSFYRKPSPDITSEYDSWFIQRNCFFSVVNICQVWHLDCARVSGCWGTRGAEITNFLQNQELDQTSKLFVTFRLAQNHSVESFRKPVSVTSKPYIKASEAVM